MSDKPSDNRRRISQNLLDEIEEYEGKDFSEQLLKWKNSSDNLSKEELVESIDAELDRLENNMNNKVDGLSRDDVREEINDALQSLRFNSATGELEMR